jgi:hypothetical protein
MLRVELRANGGKEMEMEIVVVFIWGKTSRKGAGGLCTTALGEERERQNRREGERRRRPGRAMMMGDEGA